MKTALAMITILLCFNTGDAIRCYSCASCSESIVVVECPESTNQCVSIDLDGTIARTCGTTVQSVGCSTSTVSELGFTFTAETCYCDEDLCNAPKPIESTVTGMTIEAANTSQDVENGDSISCYKCVLCQTAGTIVKCPQNVTQCTSVKVAGVTAKNCGGAERSVGCSTGSTRGFSTETCYCDGELCNGPKIPQTTAAVFTTSDNDLGNGAGNLESAIILATLISTVLGKMLS